MSGVRWKLDPWLGALLGVLLVVGSMAGLAHAARCSVAALQYRAAVHRLPAPSPETVLKLCGRAYGWYPWNYYFSIAAAELAYRQSETAPTNAAAWRELSTLWCERGLVQNPRKSELVLLKTRLLWPEAPAHALSVWAAYTDWNYWEPFNHAVLAELRAEAGDFDLAGRELALIRAFPEYRDAAARVENERKMRAAMLRGDDEGWGE